MASRKEKLTLQQHRKLGAELRRMRDYLTTESGRLGNTYGSSSKAHRYASRAADAIDKLRSEMENVMFRDASSWPSSDRESIDAARGEEQRLAGLRVYYPGNERTEPRSE